MPEEVLSLRRFGISSLTLSLPAHTLLFLCVISPLLVLESHLDRMCIEYDYVPSMEQRALCGYVGLRNPGCLCYMNSLMQQVRQTGVF